MTWGRAEHRCTSTASGSLASTSAYRRIEVDGIRLAAVDQTGSALDADVAVGCRTSASATSVTASSVRRRLSIPPRRRRPCFMWASVFLPSPQSENSFANVSATTFHSGPVDLGGDEVDALVVTRPHGSREAKCPVSLDGRSTRDRLDESTGHAQASARSGSRCRGGRRYVSVALVRECSEDPDEHEQAGSKG